MADFSDNLGSIERGENLTADQARRMFLHIMSGNAADAEIAAILLGMAKKGVTTDELFGAATVMRDKVVPIDTDGIEVLDTCGTGGDVRHTFNISTAAAIIAAAAGVKVVKHGNRSASGRAGSADVLEKLGVPLELPPDQLRRSLDECNICFAFARAAHPAMRFVAAARKSVGIPTIFNLLGPLTNPGSARLHLLGVFAPEWTEKLAVVLRELGSRRAWVVHAEDGLDEISTIGPTRVSELRDGTVHTWTFDAVEVGIPRAKLSDLQVGDLDEAASALRDVLAGRPGARLDIALLNAAAAIVIAGGAADLRGGLAMARSVVVNGGAQRTLESLARGSQV
jgi:anthranilate phosphoribosyltransferase